MSYLGAVEQKSSDIRRINVTSSTSATHTLTWVAPSEQSLIVTINGIKQQNNYTVSGTTLTLDTALVATDAMEVVGILDIGETNIPADNSITTDMIQDDVVTADKLANSINTEIAANTAKVTNATHTGDVTGATALTIATDAVDIPMLSATGTADATTFLRGDNSWTAISEYNDASIRNDIATLALHTAIADNKAAFNLTNAFIDQFEDDSGIDTETDCDRASGEYVATDIPAGPFGGIDSSTVLMLHMDGADSGTTFTDSATGGNAPHTMTAAGNAHTDTTIKKFGTASYQGDGSGDELSTPDSADWNLGSGNFSIDMWVYPTGLAVGENALVGQEPAGDGGGWWFLLKESGKLGMAAGTSYPPTTYTSSSVVISVDSWQHVAAERNGSTFKMYDNGVEVFSTSAFTMPDISDLLTVGGVRHGGVGGYGFDGYIDELRISKGVARFGGEFTPPTTAYVAASTSATGNFTSATQTANASVSEMGIVVLYKNNEGTATLNTDLTAQVSADGGSNYSSATLVAGGTFSTGINIAAVSGVSVTAGTAPKYKISFANQSAGSKETHCLLYTSPSPRAQRGSGSAGWG